MHTLRYAVLLHADTIWILVVVTAVSSKVKSHSRTRNALLHRNWAVLVSQKKCLEVDKFFSQLSDSLRQSIILSTEKLDLGLQVCEPLLLALPTLESSNPVSR